MAEEGAYRRYLEAGTTFTQVTRARAGELVHELIMTGELEHHKAKDWVDTVVRENRERSKALISMVHGEVRKHLGGLRLSEPDDRGEAPVKAAGSKAPVKVPGSKAPVKEPAGRKPPAKKAGGVRVSAPNP
jgi:polyhydroxyalkanoate synthesis regulator phasin